MKVLVTGGAGYIGSHTVRQLVKTGADVTVLDNMVYGHIGAIVDPEVKLVKGDLGDASVVYPLLMTGNFDAVIHFAAYINVGESVQNPLKYYMNNIARPLVLLGAMQAAGVKRFVFSSTCAIRMRRFSSWARNSSMEISLLRALSASRSSWGFCRIRLMSSMDGLPPCMNSFR